MKLKDYEQRGDVEARNEYDAWRILRESGAALQVGDLLEGEDARLRICKYVGLEPAEWVLPEKPQTEAEPEPANQSTAS